MKVREVCGWYKQLTGSLFLRKDTTKVPSRGHRKVDGVQQVILMMSHNRKFDDFSEFSVLSNYVKIKLISN